MKKIINVIVAIIISVIIAIIVSIVIASMFTNKTNAQSNETTCQKYQDKWYIFLNNCLLSAPSFAFSVEKWIYEWWRPEYWNYNTHKKLENLKSIGFNKEFSFHLISECKRIGKNPVNCIKIGASIAGAESSMAKRCYRNNCLGMKDWSIWYDTIQDGVIDWVTRYNRYWHKQKTPKSFYRDDWIKPVTWYCLGKKKDGVCKEWKKNSWKTFNSLNF